LTSQAVLNKLSLARTSWTLQGKADTRAGEGAQKWWLRLSETDGNENSLVAITKFHDLRSISIPCKTLMLIRACYT